MDFNLFYRRWSLIASAVLLGGATWGVLIHAIWPLIAMGILLFGIWVALGRRFLPTMPLLIGYANWVTLIRLLLVLTLLLLYNFLSDMQLFWGFLASILLDGVDGYVARRWHQESEFGAAFDMETDALLVLGLSWLHVEQEMAGQWLLLPGSMRYIYELLFQWLPQDPGSFPPKVVRATIAVIFFFALITPFVLPDRIAYQILNVAGTLIMLSFLSAIISRLLRLFNP
ncbi:MAG: CDP-alcohol phosphatidyltransferase family protein [Bacteroidota bacterium]